MSKKFKEKKLKRYTYRYDTENDVFLIVSTNLPKQILLMMGKVESKSFARFIADKYWRVKIKKKKN